MCYYKSWGRVGGIISIVQSILFLKSINCKQSCLFVMFQVEKKKTYVKYLEVVYREKRASKSYYEESVKMPEESSL